jgi:hypothetical protein
MASPLVDPLQMKASDVDAIWKTSQPGKKNGGAVFVQRIEAICKAEAAKHGFDQVHIRYVLRACIPRFPTLARY